NTGNANATGVVITDTLPGSTSFVSATGGGAPSGATVTWTIGNLVAGASGSVQLVVRVANPLANGTTLANSSSSIDSNETVPVSGGSISTTVTSTPVLALSASDSPDPVGAGANLTYTLSYSNTGNANATGVVITDTLPGSTSFVSATGGGAPSGGTVTWTIGNLVAGASGSVQLVVRVANPLANGTTLANSSSSIDSNETVPVSGGSISTTVTSTPVLALSASDSPDPVGAGANLTYTLSYSNTGNANATGVVITDTLPGSTSFVSATGGGAPSGGTVTWTIGNLVAGASGSVQLVVRVANPLANGTTLANSSSSIDSNETVPVSGGSISTTVTSTPVLALSASDSPDPVGAGANLTYTLSYSNTGNANATGVVITDTLPGSTSFVSATGGGAPSGGTVTWTIGNLVAGASGSVQLVVRVANPLANGTTLANSSSSIDSNETVPVSGGSISTTVTSTPVLALSASDSPDPVGAGANLTYTLSYSNTGNANATGVVITDTLPGSTSFVSATGGGAPSGATVTWTIGNLVAGASGSVQLVVRVANPLANGTTLANSSSSIDSNETVPVSGGSISTTVTSTPVLALSASDSPDPVGAGANLTYTLSYSNTGNANATGVVITDTLPGSTSFVSATGGGAPSGGTVTFTIGNLVAGPSSTLHPYAPLFRSLANGTTLANSSSS